MRKFRIFDREIEIDFQLSVKKVKRVEIPVPSWADDIHVRTYKTNIPSLVYYKQSTKYEVVIPHCTDNMNFKVIEVTPMYDKHRNYERNLDRKVVIDIYNIPN